MASKISINLDTSKENYLVVKCKQNDDLTLEVFIYENGLSLDLTNKTITIQALKSDGTYIIQSTGITKTNNKVLANLIRDFSRVPGTTKIEIVLIESSKQNTTFSFYLEVGGSVIRGAVQSSNTVTILEELGNKVVEANQAKEETEQLIESGNAATTGDVARINASLEQKAQKTETQNIQQQVNNLVLGAVGDGNNPEIIQARGYNGTLKENVDRIEKGKYPFDSKATLYKNNTYLDNSCIKFLQLINVDINKDYFIRQISNYTFDANVRRFVIRDGDNNLIFEGVYTDAELYTGVQFGTLTNGKQKCIFIIDWSKVNIPFVNYTVAETKISKVCINNESYSVLPKYSPIYNFIKDIKLYGADKQKSYAIYALNKSVNGSTLISIFDVTDNKIVCSFNKNDVEINKSSKYIDLIEQNNSGITARAYINWEGLVDGFTYTSSTQTLGLYLISDLCYDRAFKLSQFEDDLEGKSIPFDILAIDKIYSVGGTETNLYFKNIIKGSSENLIFNKGWGTNSQLRKNFLRNTGTVINSENESIRIFADTEKQSQLKRLDFINVACPKTVGDGVTKKCMFIGDSITDRGIYLAELKRLFDNDVMNIEFVGTQGNSIKHEGRSSWGSVDFVTSQTYADRTNNFYNPNTKIFDFSYYMSNNPTNNPDWVYIMLGTNDTWRSMNGKTTAQYIQQIVDSIHLYNSSIKIGIALIIPPYIGNSTKTTADKSNLISKNLNFEINKGILVQFKGKESSNIYIVPITSYIDAENNFVFLEEQVNSRNITMTKVCTDITHPADSGYYQIADGFYTFIKNNY